MSLTFSLSTQVSDSGPYGPLVVENVVAYFLLLRGSFFYRLSVLYYILIRLFLCF